jgi:predicted metal-dependent hydrolase
MKTKHIFVPVLDIEEMLPFVIKNKGKLQEKIKEQETARAELTKFIDQLEKNYKESIYYMGMDIIESKTYERFIFQKGGFFEIMIEAPLSMNAHFIDEKKAKNFCSALKKTLKSVLKNKPMAKMFINSIEVQDESDQGLTYEKWDRMKSIRNLK